MENDNVLMVFNDQKESILINVIDIVQIKEFAKEYIIYTLVDDDEQYVSILDVKEDSYCLKTITDDNEWQVVENILKSRGNENV